MPAISVSYDEILASLRDIGIEAGDLIYVASFLGILGSSETMVDDAINALLESVGPEGTVVVPTFNFEFCRGEDFDPATTPSITGALSEALRKRPAARRTVHPPFHSVAAIGKYADAIADIRSTSSFAKESVFHWLYLQNAKHVLLGCSYAEGVAHFHWLEEMFQVPYRYWKQFRGRVKIDGRVEELPYYMYVRRLDIDVDWGNNVDTLGAEFEEAGLVREAKLGYGKVKSFSLSDFHDFMAPRFESDKLVLVKDEARAHYTPAYTPVRRLHHIGLVSKYAPKLEKFVQDIGCHIVCEGLVPELNVNTTLYGGLNVMLEFVTPTAQDSVVQGYLERYPDHPIHHLAFEVEDFERARHFFQSRGYFPVDGKVRKGPGRDEYVYFLSPVNFGGALIELVFYDKGYKYDYYTGQD